MAFTNDPQVTSNWTRTFDTSNLGTRKLAFYQVSLDGDVGMAADYQDNDSVYYRMVRAIQEAAGGELYYLGEPQHQYGTPGTDYFIIGVADDAEPDYAYLEDTNTYPVVETDIDGWIRIDLDELYPGGGIPLQFDSGVFGGIVPGKRYYARDFYWDGDQTWVQLSDTIEAKSADGTGDYPANSIGIPGAPTQDFTADSGAITMTAYFYDISWTGRAGDTQWACCSDVIFKSIFAYRFMGAIQDASIPEIDSADWSVIRCQITDGVYPWYCCC
jgi:hypothetical protein